MADKRQVELLLPGEQAWERWTGSVGGALRPASARSGEPAFKRRHAQRILALPATSAWVLPAWLRGGAEHLRDIARLHLERLGVRPPETYAALHVASLASDDAGHLARIVALKDGATPLAADSPLPQDCRLSAACLPLPPNSIVVWRELGRLTAALTLGTRLVCTMPLTSARLDERALAELNHLCLQLSFQRVLSSALAAFIVWGEEGDLEQIARTTGLATQRQPRPAPMVTAAGGITLMPADLTALHEKQKRAERRRAALLWTGAFASLGIAALSVLNMQAMRERDTLRDRIATLTPKAARVQQHQRSWEEVAPAVDAERSPMAQLLRVMELPTSNEVMLTRFEAQPRQLVMHGRAASPTQALQFIQEIKSSEALAAYGWEGAPPGIAADNTATFELKGVRP